MTLEQVLLSIQEPDKNKERKHTMTQDQISNIEHKAAAILGTGLATWAQTQPSTTVTTLLTSIGGLLVAWAAVKSNTMNAAPPSNPPPPSLPPKQ